MSRAITATAHCWVPDGRHAGLVATLACAQADNHLEERLAYYGKLWFLILEELGYLPLETDVAHLLFELIICRYKRGSVLITTNLITSEPKLRRPSALRRGAYRPTRV